MQMLTWNHNIFQILLANCRPWKLEAYPNIRQVYLKLNTGLSGLSASAAVERLFSFGGRVCYPLRSRLTSEHFR